MGQHGVVNASRIVDDADRCYRAVRSRDRRFDGVFFTAVTTTGIYCRPSCPAVTPRRSNVVFYPSAAAAHDAGYRACRRCRPDVTPGSPEWDQRGDVTGRTMRLIADGLVEREGVTGLASRLGYSSRQLHRLLTSELGASPLALARSRRAHNARLLIETTTLAMSDIAFAAGFASIRQFNDTVRAVYGVSPRALRAAAAGRRGGPGGPTTDVEVSLPARPPFDGAALLQFLAGRTIPGVEVVDGNVYRRAMSLPHGPALVALQPGDDFVRCQVNLSDLRDLAAAVERCRRLLDLDTDPVAVAEVLQSDPAVAPLVADQPGLRVPGHVDGHELAVRAVLGQQVSVAGARTLAARLVQRFGATLAEAAGPVTRLFPAPEALADADPASLALPVSRGRAITALSRAVASGDLVLDRGADRDDVAARLVAISGIGPWTAGYVAMRALGDPDVFLPTDLGVRRGMARLGLPTDAATALRHAERWRPWRSYALMHLWTSQPEGNTTR